jgi:hypothetical protein
MSSDLIPVRVNGGLVVWHTREEYARLWAGVDRLACEQMNRPIEPEQEENPYDPR